VITEGADRLKDGAKVTLPGDAPAAGAVGRARRVQMRRSTQAGRPAEQGGAADGAGPASACGRRADVSGGAVQADAAKTSASAARRGSKERSMPGEGGRSAIALPMQPAAHRLGAGTPPAWR
jgi:multidrug efflux system membrane fusion protein